MSRYLWRQNLLAHSDVDIVDDQFIDLCNCTNVSEMQPIHLLTFTALEGWVWAWSVSSKDWRTMEAAEKSHFDSFWASIEIRNGAKNEPCSQLCSLD